MSCKTDLLEAVEGAWRAFECAPVPPRVDPSIPILFFGDLEAYCKSELRVLTVGLNPSSSEFPKKAPFCRFPLADGITATEHDRYLKALSAYFRTNPYTGWFSAFEPMLCGMGTSYYAGKPSTALHTDICSPVATDPTWSRLKRDYRDIQAHMKSKGVPLWHKLMEALCPNVVVLSVAREHKARIQFKGLSEWKQVHLFSLKKDGTPSKEPIGVWVKWYEICSQRCLFVFIRARNQPLALSTPQKCDAGKMALDEFRRGR